MVKCLNDIQNGRPTEVPVYDFTTNARIKNEVTKIEPSDVVLIEGILIFYHKDVRDIFDMKVRTAVILVFKSLVNDLTFSSLLTPMPTPDCPEEVSGDCQIFKSVYYLIFLQCFVTSTIVDAT